MQAHWKAHRSAVMPISAVVRRAAAIATAIVVSLTAPSAGAQPDAEPPPGASPPADGTVPPGPPVRVNTPDGWTLAHGTNDERHVPVPPLTTAISPREYLSSGIFVASLTGPEPARGYLEVGYEI